MNSSTCASRPVLINLRLKQLPMPSHVCLMNADCVPFTCLHSEACAECAFADVIVRIRKGTLVDGCGDRTAYYILHGHHVTSDHTRLWCDVVSPTARLLCGHRSGRSRAVCGSGRQSVARQQCVDSFVIISFVCLLSTALLWSPQCSYSRVMSALQSVINTNFV